MCKMYSSSLEIDIVVINDNINAIIISSQNFMKYSQASTGIVSEGTFMCLDDVVH